MSGITPILDTLLHQVLGRRGAPLDQDTGITGQNKPVTPLEPGRAAQALHSDSRLDSRPLPGTSADGGARPPSSPPLKGMETAGGAATHFSPAARTIAGLLARFPAPPSALRPPHPLVTTVPADPMVAAAQLASLLRQNVETSGLFYEAHLRRWLAGDFDKARLAREPQMRFASGPGLETAGPGVPAGLESVLRHQLEMLAMPVLRWEGEPWAGVLMALVLQPPPPRPSADQADEAEPDHNHQPEQEAPWQSQLTLDLVHLGEVRVHLSLSASRLDISINASPAALAWLNQGRETLQDRLTALGVETVALRISPWPEQNPGENDGET